MLELQGDFGSIVFENLGNARYITFPTETAITLFNKLSILFPNISANELGLYSFAEVGRDREARFASLDAPKHVLQSRKPGCVWTPKGRMGLTNRSIPMCPVEMNMELCPDAFWDGCLEKVFGVGNEVRDISATPEGRTLLMEILKKIYIGLGNSFYELAEFGEHPLIDEADENGWYTVGQQEWNDYKDQQAACGGHMTLVDAYKAEGLDNFNVPIYDANVNGALYTGDAIGLINSVIAKATGEFAVVLQNGGVMGKLPIIEVTSGIFNRFKAQLSAQFSTIPAMFEYYITGTAFNGKLLRNVIVYDGFNIVNNTAWGQFDAITGTITHRVLLTMPGNLGLASDVRDLKQFEGMGLRFTQRLDPPYQGKIFLDTTFKMATAILEPDFMVNASLTLTP